ncbi:MAG: hypothetical protein BWZ10_02772 [candidate division BRC1 bacterium ADurb.BinA364]|nr:MAG: hypothetical protein BWZ10_02772 [candidate division BRC1 bacterium ADurb.BinA364]
MPEKDKPILEKCRGMMRRGCLVTYSLDEGIEMEYVINDAPAGADSVSEMKAMSTQIEADIVGPGDKA